MAACRTYAGGAIGVGLVVLYIPSKRLHIVGETVDGGVFPRVSTVESGRRAALVDRPRTSIAVWPCRVKGVMGVAYINAVVVVGDDETEPAVAHAFADQGVGAEDRVPFAAFECGVSLFLFGGLVFSGRAIRYSV